MGVPRVPEICYRGRYGGLECPKKATAEDKLLTSRTPCGWRECPKTSSSSHIGLPLSHPMWVARVPDDKEAAYGGGKSGRTPCGCVD